MKKARFIRHEACDRCGSRDNVGVYDDGSKWCFGCGAYTPAQRTLQNSRGTDFDNVRGGFPNVDPRIPPTPLRWLRKYSLTDNEIDKYIPGWWAEKEMLIVFDNDSFWQGRCFAKDARTKYLSGGTKPEVTYPWTENPELLVVVEDVVSAIKVSRHATAMPIFGSYIDGMALNRALERFDKVLIWLDPNKLKEAVTAAFKASVLHPGYVGAVSSTKDPKEHTDEEIRQYLGLDVRN